jgi:sugar phosphate isomerase/epimerase
VRLALDHITAVDCSPVELVQTARSVDCDGVCLFLAGMDVLPLMPRFDLCADRSARREVRAALADCAIAFDVAYPFTLTGRSDVAAFAPAIECAAELGAGVLNVLIYDRDADRRVDILAQFGELAGSYGLRAGVEFYPPSQVGSLHDALALVDAAGPASTIGLNVDLLHLMRSGGTLAELAKAPADRIIYGQLCDGPLLAPHDPEFEASAERMLPGDGGFDLPGFVAALPPDCPLSIEIPRNHAIHAGVSRLERATAAVQAVRAALP